MKRSLAAFAFFALAGCASAPAPVPAAEARPTAQNVILFISDGASSGTWDMASFWEHGALGQQVFDSWDTKLGMTTHPLNTSRTPTFEDTPRVSYDPVLAWDSSASAESLNGEPSYFDGYHYIKQDYTDSAAAGTALATGVKTFNSGISVDNQGKPVPIITDIARSLGKSTGVVSSVPFSHATPAVFGANNISRNDYAAIAADMINNDRLDVIFGAGHPEFDTNGIARSSDFEFIGAAEWTALKMGESVRTLVEDTERFSAFARGEALPDGPVLGVPRVGATLQFGRTTDARWTDPSNPSNIAFNPALPDLTMLTLGALNILNRDPDGFFLMVEGGAVDWAAHANDTGRIIEEQIDFTDAVRATMDWLAAHDLEERTLVIVLTDHGNGMPYGPNSDTIAFQPVENRGRGVLPGVLWHHPTHTRENTRLWATGPGAWALAERVRFEDAGLVRHTLHNDDGATIDNTDVFGAMRAAMGVN